MSAGCIACMARMTGTSGEESTLATLSMVSVHTLETVRGRLCQRHRSATDTAVEVLNGLFGVSQERPS